ncbi:hypothetical protein CURTO8I2_170139 [Curtobacterium sp. 8I-2]|nr:hypothetical protein CURTO8I2_170139 [Curtobacterium sp. 8I-2]
MIAGPQQAPGSKIRRFERPRAERRFLRLGFSMPGCVARSRGRARRRETPRPWPGGWVRVRPSARSVQAVATPERRRLGQVGRQLRQAERPRRQLARPLGRDQVGLVRHGGRTGGGQAAERCPAVQRHREVARVQAVQDAVGERQDLGRAGRFLSTRDRLVDRADLRRAPFEQVRDLLRVLPDDDAHQVDPPERPRQGVRPHPRPQLRDGVDAVHVGVGDEPLDHGGVRVLTHTVQQGVRGLVRDTVHQRRVLTALDGGELGVGEVDRTVVIARHRSSVGAAGDTPAARSPRTQRLRRAYRVAAGRRSSLHVKERIFHERPAHHPGCDRSHPAVRRRVRREPEVPALRRHRAADHRGHRVAAANAHRTPGLTRSHGSVPEALTR